MQYIHPKVSKLLLHYMMSLCHSVTPSTTILFIFTAVRTSHPTIILYFESLLINFMNPDLNSIYGSVYLTFKMATETCALLQDADKCRDLRQTKRTTVSAPVVWFRWQNLQTIFTSTLHVLNHTNREARAQLPQPRDTPQGVKRGSGDNGEALLFSCFPV
jgi:hypothetical protein